MVRPQTRIWGAILTYLNHGAKYVRVLPIAIDCWSALLHISTVEMRLVFSVIDDRFIVQNILEESVTGLHYCTP